MASLKKSSPSCAKTKRYLQSIFRTKNNIYFPEFYYGFLTSLNTLNSEDYGEIINVLNDDFS